MLLFEEWGKREYPSPPLLRVEQGIEPTVTSTHACTYVVDTGKWTRVSLVGGQSSPLRQAGSSPSFPIMGFCTRFIYFLSMTCFRFFGEKLLGEWKRKLMHWMRCIHYITARYRGTGVGRLCNAYDSILTSRLICLCSKVLAIPPRNLRVAYRDHHIQIVRLKVKSGYDQLKTNCNASEPLTLQLYVLVQQRPLTKETLFYWRQKWVMKRFLMNMGMSWRESQDGDLQRNRSQMWWRTWSLILSACIVTFYQTVNELVTYS